MKPRLLDLAFLATACAVVVAATLGYARAEEVPAGRLLVVDGDTVALPTDCHAVVGPGAGPDGRLICRQERIRLEAIDAPESWRSRCAAEAALAERATRRLGELLATGPATIARHGHDRYGRTLATVTVAGRDVGATLTAEGLALPWSPGAEAWAQRLKTWCGDPRRRMEE
jgi:micrococcal nuclease